MTAPREQRAPVDLRELEARHERQMDGYKFAIPCDGWAVCPCLLARQIRALHDLDARVADGEGAK